VRVMAGTYRGVKGPVAITNPSLIFDVQLKPGGTFSQPVRSMLPPPLPSPLSTSPSLSPHHTHHFCRQCLNPLISRGTHSQSATSKLARRFLTLNTCRSIHRGMGLCTSATVQAPWEGRKGHDSRPWCWDQETISQRLPPMKLV
jgi:hypothetical protein